MTEHNAQKAGKLKITEVARQILNGEFLREFEEFLEFLKSEKISLPWKSINGFKMVYKSKNVGSITIGNSGDATRKQNYISVNVETVGWAHWDELDGYLEGQSDEIFGLLMERLENKCKQCRPTCGCSKGPGMNLNVSGKQYTNICVNAPHYGFNNSGDTMREMTLNSPCAVYPPIPVRNIPMETVKKLILARKKYI